MNRMTEKQPIVFKVRLPTHADQVTWNRFVARAQADGVTLGDVFRSLIYGYAAPLNAANDHRPSTLFCPKEGLPYQTLVSGLLHK
jgi:hypothetical protein